VLLLTSGQIKILPSRESDNLTPFVARNHDQEPSAPIPTAKTPTVRAQIAPTDFHRRQRSEPDVQPLPPVNRGELDKIDESIRRVEPDKVEKFEPEQKPMQNQEKTMVTAAVATDSKDAATDSSPEPTYSKILGQITVQRSENLSWIIKRVYGEFKTAYLKAFINANPDIKNPDRVEVGQVISLPSILVNVEPADQPVWWIKIDEKDTLEPAFNILRNYFDSSTPVRLIPFWAPDNGTKFAVVLKRLFESERSARSYREKLPTNLASNSSILSSWSKETVYFADPFFGVKN
jgi:hypothetical protein